MDRMPDGNTAALRLQQLEDEAAVRLYDAQGAINEALEEIQEAEGLKKLLNDEFLAADLADCFANLKDAISDIAKCPVKLPAVETILNRVSRMERSCFNLAMGE